MVATAQRQVGEAGTDAGAGAHAVDAGAGGPVVGGLSEVADLYAGIAATVQRLVHAQVRGPEPVIEDACQVAWSRLVHHRHRVRREAARAWLVRTAVREAFKQIRRDHRDVSLDSMHEQEDVAPAAWPALDEIVEHHARLDALRALPERQRVFLWLQGLGLSYAEVAHCTGATPRTVERQILRARRKLAAQPGDG